jgi:hypothetical protein
VVLVVVESVVIAMTNLVPHIHDFNQKSGNCHICYGNESGYPRNFQFTFGSNTYGKTLHRFNMMNPKFTGSRRREGTYIDTTFKVKN